MIYFLLLLILTIVMYLCYGAIVELTENDLTQNEEESKDGKVLLLHRLVKNKQYYFRATYFITTLIHVFLGVILYLEFYKITKDSLLSVLFAVGVFVVIILLCIYIPEKIGRVYGQKLCKRDTEEEILSMVNEGHEMGVIESSEVLMISNIFEFGDKNAKDIMINRSNMLALDSNTKLQDAIDFM